MILERKVKPERIKPDLTRDFFLFVSSIVNKDKKFEPFYQLIYNFMYKISGSGNFFKCNNDEEVAVSLQEFDGLNLKMLLDSVSKVQ